MTNSSDTSELTPPRNWEGAICRLAKFPDGLYRAEYWDRTAKSWRPTGSNVDKVLRAPDATPEELVAVGLPASLATD